MLKHTFPNCYNIFFSSVWGKLLPYDHGKLKSILKVLKSFFQNVYNFSNQIILTQCKTVREKKQFEYGQKA